MIQRADLADSKSASPIPVQGLFRASPTLKSRSHPDGLTVPIGSIISPIGLWSNASVEESRRPGGRSLTRDRGDGQEILHPLNRTSQREDTRRGCPEAQAPEDPRSRLILRILGHT